MSAEFVSLLITFIVISSLAANTDAQYNKNFDYQKYYKQQPEYMNPCYGEYGCFTTGPPFYDPKYRSMVVPPANDTDTKFLLFKRSNKNKPFELQPTKESIQKSKLDPSLKFYFIIHDYLIKDLADYIAIKDNILKHYKYNIIVVDWRHDNDSPLWQAIANARITAVKIAQMLEVLQRENEKFTERLTIVGHGLGAHLAGWVAKQLTKPMKKPSNCTGGIGFNVNAGASNGKVGGRYKANFGGCGGFNFGGGWNNNFGGNVKTNMGGGMNNKFGGNVKTNMGGKMNGKVGFGVNTNVGGGFNLGGGLNTNPGESPDSGYNLNNNKGDSQNKSIGEDWKNTTQITIDALDPYGPFFFNAPPEVRLDYTDAFHVQVIHTNGGEKQNEGLGLFQKIGYTDFYPNTGKNQPGCGDPTTINDSGMTIQGNNCSHNYAVKVYAGSIDSHRRFINMIGCHMYGRRNATWETFLQSPRRYVDSKDFDPKEYEVMGFHNRKMRNVDPANDKYFIRTNAQPPYCIDDGMWPAAPSTTAAPQSTTTK